MKVVVRLVASKADQRSFFEFPWKLYEDDPHWIPQLPSMRRDTLDKKKHPAWEYMTGEYFVAYHNGETVGTIAAFVNHRHNKFHDEHIGFFGFFECIDDQSVANALLNAASDYLNEMNVTAIRGPANFTSNEMYGLLVDSFDKDPMVLMPYNPEYYIRLLENHGYQKKMDLYSWEFEYEQMPQTMLESDGSTEKNVLRVVRRNMKRRNIWTRNFDMRDKSRDFKLLAKLYEIGWANNWGFVPLTDRELDDFIQNLGYLLLPKYTWFGYVGDEPAGFLLLIPNFNQVLKHVRPRPGIPNLWWLMQILWHWKVRPKIDSLRVVLLGVRADYRNLGVEAAMTLRLGEMMLSDNRNRWAEGGWVLETNDNMNRLLEHVGGRVHRTHRVYELPLD